MTTTIEHSQRCIELTTKQKEYEERWPNYCHRCGGYGTWSTYSWSDGPDGGPCPGVWVRVGNSRQCARLCVEDGHCARCGNDNTELVPDRSFDYLKCNDCGWFELAIEGDWPEAADMVAPIANWDGCECEWELPQNHDFVPVDWERPVEPVDNCQACGYPASNHVKGK